MCTFHYLHYNEILSSLTYNSYKLLVPLSRIKRVTFLLTSTGFFLHSLIFPLQFHANLLYLISYFIKPINLSIRKRNELLCYSYRHCIVSVTLEDRVCSKKSVKSVIAVFGWMFDFTSFASNLSTIFTTKTMETICLNVQCFNMAKYGTSIELRCCYVFNTCQYNRACCQCITYSVQYATSMMFFSSLLKDTNTNAHAPTLLSTIKKNLLAYAHNVFLLYIMKWHI